MIKVFLPLKINKPVHIDVRFSTSFFLEYQLPLFFLTSGSGGTIAREVRRVLIPKLKRIKNLQGKGKIFVFTGPATFSVAMTNSIDFRNRLNASLVGEPNQYQEKGKGFILPHSGYQVFYSIKYYQFQKEDTPGVLPDVYKTKSWQNYLNGLALHWNGCLGRSKLEQLQYS
jgi:hypothetical protein